MVSTERDWHQDAYLSPSFVNGWYAAVWIALDTIHSDCGPFEYVPGSHRWPVMAGEKVRSFLIKKELGAINPATGANHWEMIAERFTAPAVAAELRRRNSPIGSFLAGKGDVLIWHNHLMHRGSLARIPGMERRSLITHYTEINHRPDMPSRAQHSNGESCAVFDMPLRV
jgi:ectoine hydroxylase-related dioxygenase (phytanoyl-CoA dioxygenase family)